MAIRFSWQDALWYSHEFNWSWCFPNHPYRSLTFSLFFLFASEYSNLFVESPYILGSKLSGSYTQSYKSTLCPNNTILFLIKHTVRINLTSNCVGLRALLVIIFCMYNVTSRIKKAPWYFRSIKAWIPLWQLNISSNTLTTTRDLLS